MSCTAKLTSGAKCCTKKKGRTGGSPLRRAGTDLAVRGGEAFQETVFFVLLLKVFCIVLLLFSRLFWRGWIRVSKTCCNEPAIAKCAKTRRRSTYSELDSHELEAGFQHHFLRCRTQINGLRRTGVSWGRQRFLLLGLWSLLHMNGSFASEPKKAWAWTRTSKGYFQKSSWSRVREILAPHEGANGSKWKVVPGLGRSLDEKLDFWWNIRVKKYFGANWASWASHVSGQWLQRTGQPLRVQRQALPTKLKNAPSTSKYQVCALSLENHG